MGERGVCIHMLIHVVQKKLTQHYKAIIFQLKILFLKKAQMFIYLLKSPTILHSLPNKHYCHSVTKSCLTLCDPMDYSIPGFPFLSISQTSLKLMSIELGCNSTPSPPAFNLFQNQSFLMSQFLTSGKQTFGASYLVSVLSMNIQG